MISLAAFVGNIDANMQSALANLSWTDRTRSKLLLFRIETAQDSGPPQLRHAAGTRAEDQGRRERPGA